MIQRRCGLTHLFAEVMLWVLNLKVMTIGQSMLILDMNHLTTHGQTWLLLKKPKKTILMMILKIMKKIKFPFEKSLVVLHLRVSNMPFESELVITA